MRAPQSDLLIDPRSQSSLMTWEFPGLGSPGRGTETARLACGLRRVLAEVSELDPAARLDGTLAFGERLMDGAFPGGRPAGFTAFEPVVGPHHSAPATGGDLALHVSSERVDLNIEVALRARRWLGDATRLQEEVHGYRYLDSRDLTGFIDGTENPGPEDRAEVALVRDDDPEFAGGSHVFVQRWIHDLDSWRDLFKEEQERVIGRTLETSEELPDEERPDTAHISRVVVEEDGGELEIWRKSFPYGDSTRNGLQFLSFSASSHPIQAMLSRMFGVDGSEGPTGPIEDALLRFTRPVSGACFFAPSATLLDALGG